MNFLVQVNFVGLRIDRKLGICYTPNNKATFAESAVLYQLAFFYQWNVSCNSAVYLSVGLGAHAQSVRSAFKEHPSLSHCPSVSGIPNKYSLQAVEKINVYLYTRAHIFIQSIISTVYRITLAHNAIMWAGIKRCDKWTRLSEANDGAVGRGSILLSR